MNKHEIQIAINVHELVKDISFETIQQLVKYRNFKQTLKRKQQLKLEKIEKKYAENYSV